MQIQHEVQLLESGPISKGEDLANLVVLSNQTLDTYTLSHQQSRISIEHLASNPVNNIVAVYLSSTNQIILLDTKTHQRRERFPLKAYDKKFSKQSFALKGFDFSPDGSRLAVGQSDCIVYIYKLFTTNQQQQSDTANATNSNNLKPTITGKFACSSPITCLIWSEVGIIFGTQDGKIKLISLGPKSSVGGTISGSEISQAVATTMPAQFGSTNASSSTAATVAASSSTTLYSPAKVINIYTAPKGSIPLALSYKSFPSILAVSLNDNSILLLALPSELTSSPSILPLSGDLLTITTANSSQTNSGNSNSEFSNSYRRSSNFPTSFVSSLEHSCPVYYLAIMQNNTLCCAGSDGKVSLYSIQQQQQQNNNQYVTGNGAKTLDVKLIQNIDLKEGILALDYSLINETVALASKSKLLFIKYDQEFNSWQLQNSFIQITNVLSLTSLIWTKEGSQLLVGTSIGTLELFKCSWSKQTISDQLDICHIAKNRVRITDRARNLLATYKTQYDIKRVNLLNNNQSVIIWTNQSILLARLGYSNQSEIQWNGDKKMMKFSFEYQDFVLIYLNSTKEILLVRLGNDHIVFKMKFDTINRNLISARQYPSLSFLSYNPDSQASSMADNKLSPTSFRQRSAGSVRSRNSSLISEMNINETINSSSDVTTNNDNNYNFRIDYESLEERLAYVQESTCISVINLKNKTKVFYKNHPHKVIWLELSCTNKQLVFRDSQNKLYLANISSKTFDSSHVELSQQQKIKPLLEDCIFAKWLFESNILIAQSGYNIFIWYDIDSDKKSFIIDSRSFNINNLPPLIDLSCFKQQVLKTTTTTTTETELSIKKPYPTIVKTSCDQLILSNSYPIQLDKVKVRFYTEILSRRLDKAYEVLKREQDFKKTINLFYKLGWLAIEQNDCDIALKVFRNLNHKGMVDYLEKCNEVPEEKEWRLAILRGDWDLFESLVDSSQIIATYKRLNKWSRAIDYLNKSQQFRQRDLVEQEFKDWLISRGQYKKAADIQVKTGDLLGALELLIDNKAIEDATDLFVAEQKISLAKSKLQTQTELSLLELAKKLKVQLIECGNYSKVALLCDKLLSETDEALKLYLQGEDYQAAIDLVTSSKNISTEQQLSDIQLGFGNYLMRQFKDNRLSKLKALPAIDYYIASGNLSEALRASIELKKFYKAYDILKELDLSSSSSKSNNELDLGEYSLEVGDYLLKSSGEKNQMKAIEVYLIGKHYEKVIDLHMKEGNFNAAFDLSLKFKNSSSRDSTIEEFSQLAKTKSIEGKIDEAVSIYLMLDQPDKAIEILKEAKMFDRMLELVEQYYQDSLESNLLLLARQFESEGRFEDAEKYLLRASQSEWVNVVRMYRLNGKWNEAFRVAKKYCNSDKDPLLIQLAYWWSKSIFQDKTQTTDKAYTLLKELNLFNSVIEFCCENKNFQFAIDLCDNQMNNPELNHLKRDLAKKFASYLEEQQKFDKAEQVLLYNNQIEEAAQMYVDNEMYTDAIRIIESKLENQELSKDSRDILVELLNKTLILCASRIGEEVKVISNKNFSLIRPTQRGPKSEVLEKTQMAQQMYLRAQKPELAVEFYRELGMWQEAIQVAQRFAPQLLESVEQALDNQVERDVDEIIVSAGGRSSVNSAATSNKSSSRPVSRSSIIKYVNDKSDSNNMSRIKNQREIENGSNKTVDYLRSQADAMMKNGDTQGAKQALEKFVESLVDGTKSRHQGEATIAFISKQLYQIERKIIKRKQQHQQVRESFDFDKGISNELLKIANDIGRTCKWGNSMTSLSMNQHQNGDDQLVIWIRLRNILSDYLSISNEQHQEEDEALVYSNDDNNEKTNIGLDSNSIEGVDCLLSQNDLKQHLERRLLVAHYVTLHGAYVNQVQINLGQQQQRQTKQHYILSPSNAEQCFKSLLGNSNSNDKNGSNSNSRLSKQVMLSSTNGQILTCLAKLSLSLLRYIDILEARGSFYIAGLWLLAAGWRDWAYFVWSRLIEMCEQETESDRDLNNGSSLATPFRSSKFELELKRAGIPNLGNNWSQRNDKESVFGCGNGGGGGGSSKVEGEIFTNVILDEQHLNEIRSWLLECLLERDGSGAISRLVLDERGQFECSLAATPGEIVAPCLLCGYPVLSNKSGGDKKFLLNQSSAAAAAATTAILDLQVHLSEWNSLQLIVKRSNESTRMEKGNRSEWEHLQRLTLVGEVSPSASSQLNQSKQKHRRPIIGLSEVIDFLVRLSNNHQ